ncbi:germin-like protein 9-3 [Fagus crenata]
MAIAGDPDIISDFIVPTNVTTIDASFFTFTGMRALIKSGPPTNTTTFKAWKGLAHYQYNPDAQAPAIAIAAFGSSNPGSVAIPTALFNTGIDDIVLAKSFKTDVATIQALKAGLAPKP